MTEEVKLKPGILQAQETESYMLGFTGEQKLGLKTLPLYSARFWGYGEGRIVIIAARTSQGKTAFICQNAFDLAEQGKKVIVLSLEMSTQEMGFRNFCREEDVDNYIILHGGFKDNKEKWNKYKNKISKIKLIVSDCLGKSWAEINTIIESMKMNKPDVIFIDHINDIRNNGINDKQIMDDYLINIRTMAKRTGITFVIGAQINRAAQNDDDKIPQLHNLKGSGKLEEIADLVILLHWPYFYNNEKNKNEYMTFIAKNRHGQTGFHSLEFHPQYSKFKEHYIKEVKPIKDITEADINWEE